MSPRFLYPRLLAAALSLAAGALATPALAQPRVVSSQPAQGTTAGALTRIAITFSQKLDAAQSGIAVMMTGMPGMDHHQPMKMTGVKTSLADDGVTLVASLPRPLPAGSYEADWHVAGSDSQRASGTLGFTVK